MRYFEVQDNGYVLSFGTASVGGEEITEERYAALQKAVSAMPTQTETLAYRLRIDLTWEEYAVEPVDPDIDDMEAYSIIFGGAE